MKISVISPVYKAEKIVDELVARTIDVLKGITNDFELILIEDGGPDNSWEKIEENARKYPQVKGIKLSRNFGQHHAISAGLVTATGDYVIVMDCDLQDNPVYIREMVEKAEQGFDIVYTVKKERKHGRIKNMFTRMFNIVFNYLIDSKELKASGNIGSYSLISKKVREAYLSLNDYRRHYLLILRWLGFNYGFIEIEASERYEGKSSYSMKKLLMHALDGITSQTDKPLRMMAVFGFILSSCSFLAAILITILYFFQPFQAGWPSLMVLILFIGGLIILSIGVCGIYIGKTFEQTKQRPLFIVDKKINL